MNNLTIEEALRKGIEAHKIGQVQEADKFYTAILKAQPNHPDANHNMGVLAVDIGKVAEALPFFKKALETNDTIVQFWVSYLEALIRLDQFEEAQKTLSEAEFKGLKGDPFDQISSRLKKIEKSEKQKLSEDPPDDELQVIVKLYNEEKYQDALNYSKNLLDQYPQSANLFNVRGATYSALKKYDLAIKNYEDALKIKSDESDLYNWRY